MNIYQKPFCDVINISFSSENISIELDFFLQLLQIQRFAKYDHCD